jgi:hypothetical protein
MLHPALARALVTAHIEDVHRAAAGRRASRFARHVAREPHVAATPIEMLRSASTRLRRRRVPQAGSAWYLSAGGTLCWTEPAGSTFRVVTQRLAYPRTVETPFLPEVLDTGVEDKSLELDGTTPLVGS